MNLHKELLMVVLLFGFLLGTPIRAQVESDENDQMDYEEVDVDSPSRRADTQLDYDEDRRPRGLIAALFGYPDEFEDAAPVDVGVEDAKASKGRSSYGFRRDFKKLKTMTTTPIVKSARTKTASPWTTTARTTTTDAELFSKLASSAPAENEVPQLDNLTDSTPVTSNSSGDGQVPDLDTAESTTSNSTNATEVESSSSSKREANPSKGKDTRDAPSPSGPLPFGAGPQPMPAGYILWHPVPAPFFGAPEVPEMSLASDKSPMMALPGPPLDVKNNGPPMRGFMPHRPMFVEPFQGPFPPNGPFPITEFSTPPVFAIAPEEPRGGGGRERNKKPNKGSKSKGRQKNRPQPSNDDGSDNQERPGFFPPRGMAPVHVLLPQFPMDGFRNGPNFDGPNFRPQGNDASFQPNFDQRPPQQQPLRQLQFDQRPQQSQQFPNRPPPLDGPNGRPQFPQQFPNVPRMPEGPGAPQPFQNAPIEPFRGQQGEPFRGPEQQSQKANKPKRPSPTPSAHPAKFEIEHQKKLQEQFEKFPPPPPPLGPFFLPNVQAPPPAHFNLPPVRQQQFHVPAPPAPFSVSAPPPQFLDAPPPQSLPLPKLPPQAEQSPLAASNAPLKSPPPGLGHSVPPLLLPPPLPFPPQQQQQGDDFRPISTTPSSMDEQDTGLIYTRDFQKQINEIQPTTQRSFLPSSSQAPVKQQRPNFNSAPHFGLANAVQRFPAISGPFGSGQQQGLGANPHQSPLNSFGNRPRNEQQGSGPFGNDQRRPQFQSHQNQFAPSNQQWSQRHQQEASMVDAQRLPNTHPNLPDFKPELDLNQRFNPSSTTNAPEILSPRPAPAPEPSQAFHQPPNNYPSPGFHTGHKGFPSSVTAPNYIASSEAPTFPSTTPIPRVHRPTPTTKLPSEPFGSATAKSPMPKRPKNFFGTTFQSSFASSTANSKVPEYHYEIHYQQPATVQNAFAASATDSRFAGSGSTTAPVHGQNQRISDVPGTASADSATSVSTPSPFGLDTAPEYVSSTFRPQQAQGGSYKPGTSRILLEMNQWKKDELDQSVDSGLRQ